MFIGRSREMEALVKRYEREGFEFPVIYGRRRVGKTRLIQEFLRGRRGIYFMATEQGRQEQLSAMTAAIREQYHDPRTAFLPSFSDFDKLFAYLAEISRSERIIFVIDEFPYLAKAVPEISSVLQKYIDQEFQKTQLYLILCGSSMSFMERQVLGYNSPLYGRRTAQIKLHPLPYYESMQFFPDWTAEERLEVYGICGGIPQYLQYMARYPSLEEAVVEEFLSTGGHLAEEPGNLMLQELREPLVYNSILNAIAHGASRQNEIAQAVGKESGRISFYLGNLMDLEIVSKKVPIESKNSRKGIYGITDQLYRFWYRFMPECASLSAMGLGKRAWEEKIMPSFPEYFGHVFEDICLQYVQYLVASGQISELYTAYGSWWGTNPLKHREEEIDIVCTSYKDVLCGECKWRNELLDESVLETLRERSQLVQKGRRVHYALFSKSGFTEAVRKEPGILLAGLSDLLEAGT